LAAFFAIGAGAAALATVEAASAQPAIRGCTAPNHDELDFLLGDWNVHWTGAQGRSGLARSSVTKGLDDCVVFEEFLDRSTGQHGKSMSAYVASVGKWVSVRMDNRPSLFQATGGPTTDGGFELEMVPTGQGQMQGRVRIEDIQPNSLTWRLQSKSGEDPWKDVIVAEYRRR
jgi:hypothetical protein